MNEKKTINIRIQMNDEIRNLLSDISKMDKESQTKLKDEVTSISKWTAQGIIEKSYFAPMPAQAAIVAQSVKAKRDRTPYVQIGGSSGKKTRSGATAGDLLFGNEFGANPKGEAAFPNGGRRFPYRSAKEGRGNAGYWIFPAVKEMQPEITHKWKQAVNEIFRHWQRFG